MFQSRKPYNSCIMENLAVIITVDGDLRPCTSANGSDFKLEEAQKIVGGYIESVYLDDDTIMIVNENGKFEQPPNTVATLVALKKGAISQGDYISGDVIVCDTTMLR